MTTVRLEEPAARSWDFPRATGGVALLVRYAAGHGVTATDALAGSGLAEADLADGSLVVTAAQELRVIRNLQRRLGQVGRQVGATYDVGTFGILGYALVSSRTLLEAMNVALRFIDLSHTFAIPSGEVVGDRVRITVDGTGLPADVRDFLVARDATAIRAVLGGLAPGGVPVRLRLLGPTAQLDLPVADLGRELTRADAGSLALSEQLCRDVASGRRSRPGTSGQVLVHVTQRLRNGSPMAEVAGALGWSERTLRRRLTAEGTSYQRLLDEAREPLAHDLLATGLRVEDVAHRLGYAEAASFIHAFRRWTGRTPGSNG